MTVKEKKPRKKYLRPATARFTTEESKLILRALCSGQSYLNLTQEDLILLYKIKSRLEYRIEKEEKKNENGKGNQGDN